MATKATAQHGHLPVHERRRGPSKNNVSTEMFEILGRWASDMGLTWIEVLKELRVPTTTAWRIGEGTAGMSVFSSALAWLRAYAAMRGVKRDPMKQLDEWTELGKMIAKEHPEVFGNVIDTVRSTVAMLPKPQRAEIVTIRRTRRRAPKRS